MYEIKQKGTTVKVFPHGLDHLVIKGNYDEVQWNKEIFDAPTLDLLMMSPWFCGEAARIFRDCPHLVGNWLTASWLNKARALGTLK